MKRRVSESATLPGDLADLRAFGTVADLGSMTAAARVLGETKGAVSRRVSRLERALGVSLLRRSTRAVAVTEEGAAFRARVGRALEMLDEAARELVSSNSTPHGLLRITAPADLSALLAPPIAAFAEAHPAVRIEATLTQAELDFDAHQLDVAFRASGRLRDSSLIAHKLIDMDFGVFASPDYLAKNRAPRRPADLAAHRLVVMRFRPGDLTLTLRHEADPDDASTVSLRGVITGNDNAFVTQLAVAGAGVALLPTLLGEREVAAGRLVRLLRRYRSAEHGALYLLHSASPFLPLKVRVFRDFIKSAIERNCAAARVARLRVAAAAAAAAGADAS